jgi:diguanylate cyclase (GGDEF)-like protein
LPNERGFFLVLENQLAQSVRYRDQRPLTVLAMDVRNFAEINQTHGHAAGDRLLAFAAALIKKQLRQMDVLTRSSGDEFLAILPTATEKISTEVTERIRRAFVSTPFRISERENINLAINFGTATFWRDGETANELLKTALLRKGQDKSAERSKVIWFPKEFVN